MRRAEDVTKLDVDPQVRRWLTARRDPYAAYRALREAGPVQLPGVRLTIVAGYSDACDVLRAPSVEAIADGTEPAPPLDYHAGTEGLLAGWPLFATGESHRRMRAAMTDALHWYETAMAPAAVADVAADVLAPLRHRAHCDGVRDVAQPFARELMRRLLGIPAGDLATVAEWVRRGSPALDPLAMLLSPARAGDALAAIREGQSYVATLVDGTGHGLLGRLLAHPLGLSRAEVLGVVENLIGASVATTQGLTAALLMCALQAPGPVAGEIDAWETAAAEAARLHSPAQAVFRHATAAIPLAAGEVPAGHAIAVLVGSANRDERAWSDPESFVAARSPNPHLAFAVGRHACVGGRMARRAVATIGMAFTAAFPDARLAVSSLKWSRNLTLRTLVELPIELRGASPPR